MREPGLFHSIADSHPGSASGMPWRHARAVAATISRPAPQRTTTGFASISVIYCFYRFYGDSSETEEIGAGRSHNHWPLTGHSTRPNLPRIRVQSAPEWDTHVAYGAIMPQSQVQNMRTAASLAGVTGLPERERRCRITLSRTEEGGLLPGGRRSPSSARSLHWTQRTRSRRVTCCVGRRQEPAGSECRCRE